MIKDRVNYLNSRMNKSPWKRGIDMVFVMNYFLSVQV